MILRRLIAHCLAVSLAGTASVAAQPERGSGRLEGFVVRHAEQVDAFNAATLAAMQRDGTLRWYVEQ